jgi:hypothetical protein
MRWMTWRAVFDVVHTVIALVFSSVIVPPFSARRVWPLHPSLVAQVDRCTRTLSPHPPHSLSTPSLFGGHPECLRICSGVPVHTRRNTLSGLYTLSLTVCP